MFKKRKKYSIGIDVGGTKIKSILFDGKNIITDFCLDTPNTDLETFVRKLEISIEPLIEKAKKDNAQIEGIGLGIAGVLNSERKKVLDSPNIKILNNIALGNKLSKRTKLPVVMDNDANCFLLAEMKMGAGKAYKNVYAMIIGTGIGGAWWFNNEIYRGANGGAGEPKSIVVNFNSEINLGTIYNQLIESNPTRFIDEALSGKILARENFSKIGAYLGIALSNIVNILDPEIIILGGGLTKFDSFFIFTAKEVLKKNIHSSESKRKIKILKGGVGKFSGAVGAALLVL